MLWLAALCKRTEGGRSRHWALSSVRTWTQLHHVWQPENEPQCRHPETGTAQWQAHQCLCKVHSSIAV